MFCWIPCTSRYPVVLGEGVNMDTQGQVEDHLRKAIKDSGISQGELSRLTGMSQPAISLFLTGKSGLSRTTLERLLSYFGLELTIQQKLQNPAPKPSTSVPQESPRTAGKEGKPSPTPAKSIPRGPDYLSMPVTHLPERCWRKMPRW
jgi:transcriptional regulator with XRE-family HTH domain